MKPQYITGAGGVCMLTGGIVYVFYCCWYVKIQTMSKEMNLSMIPHRSCFEYLTRIQACKHSNTCIIRYIVRIWIWKKNTSTFWTCFAIDFTLRHDLIIWDWDCVKGLKNHKKNSVTNKRCLSSFCVWARNMKAS